MTDWHLVFRVHALQRMFSRQISDENVRYVIRKGEVIEDYPADIPYPSKLILGWIGSRPLHVVVAENRDQKEVIIITVYEPSAEKWENGFRRRKS